MVRVNDFVGGYKACKYLLDIGHQRIGMITGQISLYNCIKRLEGCKKAFDETGIPFDNSLVYEADFRLASGMEALPYLLGKGVTAIFAFNDMIAYGVYKGMRDYNLSIPDDLSVIGFDDIFFSDIIYPPLTTMEYPIKEMAAAVVSRLIDRVDSTEQAPPQVMTFDPTLKVRGSTREHTSAKDINGHLSPSPAR